MMLSEIIRLGDIVYFRNGQCAEVGSLSLQILDQYYSRVDSMLKTKIDGFECPSNHDYDIVYGPIADDGVVYQLTLFEQHLITIEQLVEGLTYRKLNNQYFFGTKLAISKLNRI